MTVDLKTFEKQAKCMNLLACASCLALRKKSNFENSIMEDTPKLNNLRTWINTRGKSFIKTSVNIK